MGSRRNSKERRCSVSINASLASPRPGGFIKIRHPPPILKLDLESDDSKASVQEVQRSLSRARLLRNMNALYSPKSRRKSEEDPPCAKRKTSLCLTSCTSIATTDSTSKHEEEDIEGTDSSEFPLRQDADLNIIMGVVVSTVMVLAEGKYSCSDDHLLWTAHFLETIKDEHGRMPPNVAGILNYIKYIRLKEETSKNENLEQDPSAEGANKKERSQASIKGEEGSDKKQEKSTGSVGSRNKSRDLASSSTDSFKTAARNSSISSIRSHGKSQTIPEENVQASPAGGSKESEGK